MSQLLRRYNSFNWHTEPLMLKAFSTVLISQGDKKEGGSN